MIPDTKWEPTPRDIAWQSEMVRILKNKGTWAVPGTMSVFELDKPNKTFKLIIGEPDAETNRRIAKVFKRLGFSEKEDDDTNLTDRLKPSDN
jgi:hypothetical protein